MKYRLFSLLILGLLLVPSTWVIAAEPSDTATTTTTDSDTTTVSTSSIQSITDLTATSRTTLKTSLQTYQNLPATDRGTRGVAAAKAYLGNLITVRTRAIEQLEAMYSTGRCKDIDTTAKQAITGELSEIKASLVNEQTEVTAMTAVGTAPTLAKTIIQNDRVFVIVAPAAYGACAAQNIIRVRTHTLTQLATKLKEAGYETTNLDTYLSQSATEATSAYGYFLDALQTRSTNPTTKIQAGKGALTRAKQNLSNAKDAVTLLSSQTTTTN